MATRFHLAGSAGSPVSPTRSPEWAHPSGYVAALTTTSSGTSLSSIGLSEGVDHLVDLDALFGMFVSPPLVAQTISSQVIQLAVQGIEADAGNNLFVSWKLWIWQANGTVGPTLVPLRRATTQGELGLTLNSRLDAATSATVTVADGDRVVLELGAGGLPVDTTGVQGHGATLLVGESGASDITATGQSSGTLNPWLEFANTLTFQAVPTTTTAVTIRGWVDGSAVSGRTVDIVEANDLRIPDNWDQVTANGLKASTTDAVVRAGGRVAAGRATTTTAVIRAGGRLAPTVIKTGITTGVILAGGHVAVATRKTALASVVLRAMSRDAIVRFVPTTTTDVVLRGRAGGTVVGTKTTVWPVVIRSTARVLTATIKTTAWPAVLKLTGRGSLVALHASSEVVSVRASVSDAIVRLRASATSVTALLVSRGGVLTESLRLQVTRPVADLVDGSWTNQLGSNVDLYASIDEPNADTADYIQSSLSPLVVDQCRVLLAPLDDPGTTSNHTLHLVYKKDDLAGDRIDLTVTLYAHDGTTAIATVVAPNLQAQVAVDIEILPSQAALLTSSDYELGLILEFSAVKV